MSVWYTNKPWISVSGTTTGKAVVAPNEPKVRRNVAMVGGPNRDANAQLISAAPDMYEALKSLLEALSTQGSELGQLTPDAEAAISKAEGRL